MAEAKETETPLNFIEEIIKNDLENGKHQEIVTRFPPEPNGFLHIGHAKAICLNFGLGERFGGKTNLRFDDTNPVAEDTTFVEGIMEDIAWLGYQWQGEPRYASDYFDELYEYAVQLIKEGKAYVDDSTSEEIRQMKGTPTEPGTISPYASRSVEENLDLFERMKNGEFEEGSRVLRARIDMASPNMHLRDPLMYRIIKHPHHRTGTKWSIYPMYDWAHGQSDAIEGITHSLCSLEFQVHRPLYDWFLDQLPPFEPRPVQTEFARLNLSYTVMSKRKLRWLVETGVVNGWDDPRMPTLAGLRRRGYTPESIRNFANGVGVAKRNNVQEIGLLEFSIRDHLNKIAPRVMAVLDPVKLVITNYPEGQVEWLPLENNPEDPDAGSREIPFSRELYIEREDFMEDAPKKFFRMTPGRNVRLKGAYILNCVDFDKDAEGNVTEIRCTYFPETKSGSDNSGIKAKGVLHFVSAAHAHRAEVRLYDRLFNDPDPDGHKDKEFKEFINPDSLKVLKDVPVEPSLKSAKPGDRFQFMRLGYFTVDPDTTEHNLVFNRTVTLKDSWAKAQNKK